jgi:hypothetical protein
MEPATALLPVSKTLAKADSIDSTGSPRELNLHIDHLPPAATFEVETVDRNIAMRSLHRRGWVDLTHQRVCKQMHFGKQPGEYKKGWFTLTVMACWRSTGQWCHGAWHPVSFHTLK